MEKTVTRRGFLSGKRNGDHPPERKQPVTDPYFIKYANKEVPFANARTQSGLSTYTGPFTEAELRHLLRRTTFGATRQAVSSFQGMTLQQVVDALIDNPVQPNVYPVNVYQDMYPDTQGVPAGESWVYWNAPDNGDGQLSQYRMIYSFKPWWIGVMLNQSNHILERMTLFWANHFGTQTEDFNFPKAIFAHHDMLRKNALGNFRTLIKAVTIDPHMLEFLNGGLNMASAPDENYARELQELFTIGKGPDSGYTEDDVKQAAKILTGWRRKVNPDGSYSTYFNAAEHDTSNKQFSSFYGSRVISGQQGADGALETDALLDMLLSTAECAKYICRCLYRWFVYYVIDDATESSVIIPLAGVLRNSGYDISLTLKALLTSDHFFDPLNRACIIKSPTDLYVGIVREMEMNLPTEQMDKYRHWQHFKNRLDEGGQQLGDPPNVAGWPAYYQTPVYYQLWINSNTVKKRNNAIGTYCTVNGYPVDGSNVAISIDSVAYAQKFAHPEDPNAVVAEFCNCLLPQPVSSTQMGYMLDILLKTGQDHYWTDAWYAYISNPSDPVNDATVRTRLSALVHYIATLEEFQLF